MTESETTAEYTDRLRRETAQIYADMVERSRCRRDQNFCGVGCSVDVVRNSCVR